MRLRQGPVRCDFAGISRGLSSPGTEQSSTSPLSGDSNVVYLLFLSLSRLHISCCLYTQTLQLPTPSPSMFVSMPSFLPSLSYTERKCMSRIDTGRQEKDTPKGLGLPSLGTPFCPVLEAKLLQYGRWG